MNKNKSPDTHRSGLSDGIRQNDNADEEKKNCQQEASAQTETFIIHGIIYRYILHCNDPFYDGKCYVGETDDEKTRRASWNKPDGGNYAGKKLKDARAKWGKEYWTYEILERFTVYSEEEYKTISEELETKWIAHFDSYENGFNGNRGGKGNKGVKFDEKRCKQNGDNRRGKPQPRASIEQGLKKRKGYQHSAETCAKIGDGNRGKKRSDEQCAKQSERMKGVEPKAASEGARKWRENNPGGWWANHPINPESVEKRKLTVRNNSQRIKVTDSNGNVNCYLCQTDAAIATGLKDGSINYALNKSNGVHRKSGYSFKKITQEAYDEWKEKEGKSE
jgi:hypothetical protein